MDLTAIFLALAPSLGLGFLFYKIMKALLEGDRNERLAHARWEAAHEDDSRGPARAEGPVDRGRDVALKPVDGQAERS